MNFNIESIRFSSGRATVDYQLPENTDPALFEMAVCQSVPELIDNYNDLELDLKTGMSQREINRERSGMAGCLIAGIGLMMISLALIVMQCIR